MTKVVYNACYGGFGLSKEACQRYWDIKGQQVWIEDAQWGFDVWLVPLNERLEKAYRKQTWYYNDVSRHDPVLVQVVEELGDKANGYCAELAIYEVYDSYRIDEYDGYESVETADSYDWITP
jgi:uncharacterized protein (UPF0371 family)